MRHANIATETTETSR